MKNKEDFAYHFNSNACKPCGGKCCRGLGGYVWISMEELTEMANTSNMETDVFARQYVRQVHGKLALKEHVINGETFLLFF